MKTVILILLLSSVCYSQEIYFVKISQSDKQDTLYKFFKYDNGIDDTSYTVGFEASYEEDPENYGGIIQFYTAKESFCYTTKALPKEIMILLIKRAKEKERFKEK